MRSWFWGLGGMKGLEGFARGKVLGGGAGVFWVKRLEAFPTGVFYVKRLEAFPTGW